MDRDTLAHDWIGFGREKRRGGDTTEDGSQQAVKRNVAILAAGRQATASAHARAPAGYFWHLLLSRIGQTIQISVGGSQTH